MKSDQWIKITIQKTLEIKDEEHINKLIEVFKETVSHKIRNRVAICFADLAIAKANIDYNKVADAMVEVLGRDEMYNHRAIITYSCTELTDLSRYFYFFANLVITDTWHTSSNALDVVINMKSPFEKSELDEIFKKIKAVKKVPDHHKYLYKDLTKFIKEQYLKWK